jgi:Ca2+-binding RTX toxin-like protein
MSIRTSKLTGSSGYAYVATRNTATVLKGSALDDHLLGAGSNDLLEGGLGADLLNGGAGIDTAIYANSAAAVSVDLMRQNQTGGEAQGDRLVSVENVTGSRFNDALYGDAANNVFQGGAGADIIDGRDGSDSACYATSDAAVQIDLRQITQSGGHAQGDMLQNIENVIGSRFNDSIIGNHLANELFGGAGHDVLEGLGGADVINGGDGNDTASYSQSRSAVTIDLRAATQSGGDAGGDRLISIENVNGSIFDDTLIGNGLANILSGGNGNDTLEGLAGADTLNGGQGTDTASYANSSAAVFVDLRAATQSGGDAAGDRLVEIENVVGSRFNDSLVGNGFDNVLTGGAGNDLIEGLAGADTLIGGDGIDTATYARSVAAAVTVDMMAAVQSGGDAAGDRLVGIENLIGTRFGDRLSGDAMANELNGGAGDDVIEGGGGADRIIGGDGFDIASYSRSAAGVAVGLATNTGTSGDARGDILFGIEGLIGSRGNDTLTGNTANNWFAGGLGADIIDGGTGTDTVSYAGSSAISLNLARGVNRGGDAEGDVLRGIEIVIGSGADDVMIAGGAIVFRGGDGADRLTGGVGADRLFGDAGEDMIEGGAGADTLDGGASVDDTVSYAGSSQGVKVNLATRVLSGGDAQGDQLSGFEHVVGSAHDDELTGDSGDNGLSGGDGRDVLSGGDGNDLLAGGVGNDVLFGSNGNDTMFGGDGADFLSGGQGNDIMFGGAGADRFSGPIVSSGRDRIMDFQPGEDIIMLYEAGWTVSFSEQGALISNRLDIASLLLAGIDQATFQTIRIEHWY